MWETIPDDSMQEKPRKLPSVPTYDIYHLRKSRMHFGLLRWSFFDHRILNTHSLIWNISFVVSDRCSSCVLGRPAEPSRYLYWQPVGGRSVWRGPEQLESCQLVMPYTFSVVRPFVVRTWSRVPHVLVDL